MATKHNNGRDVKRNRSGFFGEEQPGNVDLTGLQMRKSKRLIMNDKRTIKEDIKNVS